jgi:hypothetical protein
MWALEVIPTIHEDELYWVKYLQDKAIEWNLNEKPKNVYKR